MAKTRIFPDKYHQVAQDHGFKWLGPEVSATGKKTTWQCGRGHIWESGYSDIQDGKGCPECKYLQPEDYHQVAQDRGFKWLGPKVFSSHSKTTWKCKNGHIWEAMFHTAKRKGCPHCITTQSEDFYRLAQDRGFKWLGPKVSNARTLTTWQCKNGHTWEARYDNIRQGKGCPHCRRLQSADYHQIAQERGLEWLGPEVLNTYTKTVWRCQNGHVWKAIYDSIKQGNGCPKCTQTEGEKQVEDALKRLSIDFDSQKSFETCRNPQTGRLLLFDFCATIDGAHVLIEFDGYQHMHPVDFAGRGDEWANENLNSIKHRDSLKNQWARDNGYNLIRIPYTTQDIQQALITALAQ